MQKAETILKVLHERGSKGLPLERVYRMLYNPELYLSAYGKIYRNMGAMTHGVTEETPDAMSLQKVELIIDAIRHDRYQWLPARRTYIPKRNGKLRPLGMPVWSDKLVQEVLRMLLEAYYEPQPSECAHGFRPGRGCHTALREIHRKWNGTTWLIEGDISQCFDRLDHQVLLSIFKEKIQDAWTIGFINELLGAGYMEKWTFNATLSGVPQGGVLSPLLSNIYLDKLDKYVEETLIPNYTRGTRKGESQEYHKLLYQASQLRKEGELEAAQALKRQAQRMPSKDTSDPDFRRLRYVRYADDFLLGFIGPRSEAEEIKQQIGTFLRDQLKLDLSQAKTLITHARTEAARFLSYEIHVLHQDAKHDQDGRRNINGVIGLRVPQDIIQEKCRRYQQSEKAMQRAEMLNDSTFSIVGRYQAEYRGLAEYYQLAYNLAPAFGPLKWAMEQSLVKTLATKLKISVSAVYRRFQATILISDKPYKGLQVTVPKDGKKPLVAQWAGIPLKWKKQAVLNDQPFTIWNGKTELEQRLLADACEYCGATGPGEEIEVHHIRALKDLNRKDGREKPEWVKMMAARQRKTMVLCRTCHQDITYGRPMRRSRSQSGFYNEYLLRRQASSS
jgi:group II intron reverse transcriptase/maturase